MQTASDKMCGERRIRTFEACAADLQSALVGHLSISPKFQIKSFSKEKLFCDRAGARTQDPLLKREMLYQLSYQVLLFFKSSANIPSFV